MLVVFAAPGATSWDVFHRVGSTGAFTLIADDTIVSECEATGLAAGHHEFIVTGRNSRGTGPASDTAAITLTA